MVYDSDRMRQPGCARVFFISSAQNDRLQVKSASDPIEMICKLALIAMIIDVDFFAGLCQSFGGLSSGNEVNL